jgi:pimeloyl-ACP methyl ester carboxylesterase
VLGGLSAFCVGALVLGACRERRTDDPTAGVAAIVSDAGPSCDLSGVRSVDVPLEYANPYSGTLSLRYRVFPTSRPDAPTIIVVPGGPGADIMHTAPTDPTPVGAIRTTAFNVIYADARGSGCNVQPDLPSPEKVYTIEAVARDLLAVVRAERLTNYIMYGVSFGTAAATVATSIARAEGTSLPRRLVLEGTVGHSFSSFDEYFAAFAAEWDRVKPLLSPVWQTALSTEPWPPALLWSREQWGEFVSAQLILGEVPGQGPILKVWLDGLSALSPTAQQFVGGFMAGVKPGALPPPLFRTIACRELWGSWRAGREILDGGLRAPGEDVCGGHAADAPYDSKTRRVDVPITYFQGPHDPTTTLAQATYHLDNHASAPRQFVIVPGASHAPLTLGLQVRGCSESVWQALDVDASGLDAALRACAGGDPVELRTLAAAP